VDISRRLRTLREVKRLSQGDIEHRTGLLRCYISRVENGHTVPAIETLEKIARALETPLYQLFYEGEDPPQLEITPKGSNRDWASHGKGYRTLRKFQQALGTMDESHRRLLLEMATVMAGRKRKSNSKGVRKQSRVL
jgi:transcriptional regulator with XRE-family HTH domain